MVTSLRAFLISAVAVLALHAASGPVALAGDASGIDEPHAGARLFPAGRIRLGTGLQVPASALGETLAVRKEPDGSALAFVSFPGEDDHRGAVYVFARAASSAWRWTQTLLPSDHPADWRPEEDTRKFGDSLALDGDRLLVGAPFHHRQHGAVYVFERDQAGRWLPAGQLVPAHHWELTNTFGDSVALTGDNALVGSSGDDSGQGAAYVFERGGDGLWRQVQRIASHHYAPPDEYGYPSLTIFGDTVALDREVAVIGAKYANYGQGAATLYTRAPDDGRFVLTTELQPLQTTDGYGCAVAVEEDTVLVGASDDSGTGAVYAFSRRDDGVWLPAQRLSPISGHVYDRFGWSIALDGDLLAVGAPGNDGAAHVYRRDGGRWRHELGPLIQDSGPRPVFGRAVALSGDVLLVGDIGDTSRCPTGDDCHTGAAHAYELAGFGTGEGLDNVYRQKLVFTPSWYGRVVAANEDLVIVGDPEAKEACRPEEPPCASGAVHILEPGDGVWVESQRITPADRSRLDFFGYAVAQDGDWLAVSAVGSVFCSEDELCSSSAVYLYRRGPTGAWSEAQRIPSPRSEPGFGTGLALRGDLLLIGRTELETDRPDDSASVHIYRLEPSTGRWLEEDVVAVYPHLWRAVVSIVIDGPQLLLPSVRWDDQDRVRGGIAVLERDGAGWSESQFLDARGLEPDNMAAEGGVLAVRRIGDDGMEVAVYERDSGGVWSLAGALPPPDVPVRGIGASLSVSGDYVLVGDLREYDSPLGSAHLYRRQPDGSRQLVQTLTPLEPDETGAFGFASSLRGRTAVIGAPGSWADPSHRPGQVSIYRLQGPRVYLPALHTVRRRF